ncbi:hypothetical protein GUJ93_ZPchr0001g32471 [Zizania palustris]|uniref:Uncharacterized protein n=1 Tax=Zizania palustris TaxID=103762 RepID=A0A8J5RXU2_ZIZPA|nr:hypothetical protein GUJ93_ZPchr0001g32471 [Zizania palustris]
MASNGRRKKLRTHGRGKAARRAAGISVTATTNFLRTDVESDKAPRAAATTVLSRASCPQLSLSLPRQLRASLMPLVRACSHARRE